ncbi:MAG: hypothetical protein ACTHJP_10090 [Rhodanobacteraceae bacterium]
MPEPPSHPNASTPTAAERREIKWDAVAAIIASLVGFLALLVAGYTAYVQRYTAEIQNKQVQAQVWPYVISGNDDLNLALTVSNQGVGPAIVRGVQVRMDGKPQSDWNHIVANMGLPPHSFFQSTINRYVLSPGERLQIIRFSEKALWQRFENAALNRMSIDICFCSTLGECWMSRNKNLIGLPSMPLQLRVDPVDQCPRLPPAEAFNN